jgi:hypothetical protein
LRTVPRKGVKIHVIDRETNENEKHDEAKDDDRADPAVAALAVGEILGRENVQEIGPRLDTYLGNVEQNDSRKIYLAKAPRR